MKACLPVCALSGDGPAAIAFSFLPVGSFLGDRLEPEESEHLPAGAGAAAGEPMRPRPAPPPWAPDYISHKAAGARRGRRSTQAQASECAGAGPRQAGCGPGSPADGRCWLLGRLHRFGQVVACHAMSELLGDLTPAALSFQTSSFMSELEQHPDTQMLPGKPVRRGTGRYFSQRCWLPTSSLRFYPLSPTDRKA